jgi:hypothetical protein
MTLGALQDDTDFYTNVMGWTIPADASSFTDLGTGGYPGNALSGWSLSNVHSDTEGDALRAWNQQYKRYGYTTDNRLHYNEPGEPKAFLKSDNLKSGIL